MAGGIPSTLDLDAAALDALSRRYSAVFRRYFIRKGVAEADCEDLVQELFAKLARQDALAAVSQADAYLFEMAANLARDYHRRAHVRRVHPAEGFFEQLQVSAEFAPDRIFEGRESLALVSRALAELPERTRHVFILARLENVPRAEIAERFGIAKRTVEKMITVATAHIGKSRERGL